VVKVSGLGQHVPQASTVLDARIGRAHCTNDNGRPLKDRHVGSTPPATNMVATVMAYTAHAS